MYLIRVASLYKFARHSRHKAEDDFLCYNKVLERGYDPTKYIRENKRLVLSYNKGTLTYNSACDGSAVTRSLRVT